MQKIVSMKRIFFDITEPKTIVIAPASKNLAIGSLEVTMLNAVSVLKLEISPPKKRR